MRKLKEMERNGKGLAFFKANGWDYNAINASLPHTWNFRGLQFYIEYKAKLSGLPVVYVNPRHISSLCPICGGED
ncbi:MAG: zinc ribbon domain-containing protein [Candidatus Bathyarchaeia archaeon]